MADGRLGNGRHSTKSKKAVDRRKRMSFDNPDVFNEFFEGLKEQMYYFYDAARKEFYEKNLNHGMFYVYFHYLDGEVVYIGKGSKERVYSWNRRLGEHKDLVQQNKIDAKIIANNLDEDNAFLIESALIKELNPKFNVRGREKE